MTYDRPHSKLLNMGLFRFLSSKPKRKMLNIILFTEKGNPFCRNNRISVFRGTLTERHPRHNCSENCICQVERADNEANNVVEGPVIYERKSSLSCQTQHRNFRVAKWPRSFESRAERGGGNKAGEREGRSSK